jgi:hypothetical protein
MTTGIYLTCVLVALSVLYLVLRPLLHAYLKFRGTRVITCPETRKPAAVEMDAKHAAVTAVLGKESLRLSNCSRWPERRHCGQECLQQIEAAPAACLLKTILANWYAGKGCVLCGKPLDEAHWSIHKPALMNAERRTFEWPEISPEQVPEVLATHFPVCWDCHIAETFRRLHPEQVIDWPVDGSSPGRGSGR